MTLYMDPSAESRADVILDMLEDNDWRAFTVITDTSRSGDAIWRRILKLVDTSSGWNIQSVITFEENKLNATSFFTELKKNTGSKVIVLHCGAADAQRIFTIAGWLQMTSPGYTWIITDKVFSNSKQNLRNYPENIMAIRTVQTEHPEELIHDAVAIVTRAVAEMAQDQLSLPSGRSSCWQTSEENTQHDTLFR